MIDKESCDEMLNEDLELNRVNKMIQLLGDQLKTMPTEFGAMAMIQLLVSNCPFSKEKFLEFISTYWDVYSHKEN